MTTSEKEVSEQQGAQALEPIKANSLMAALKEAQDTVRAYDTKAQIIGVGYIFAFDIVQSISRMLTIEQDTYRVLPIRLTIAWVLVFVPLIMFARVLYPSRWSINSAVTRMLYVPNADSVSAEQFHREFQKCDWEKVISTEIIQVSRLRDLKRKRFVLALWAAAISYSLMFLFNLARSLQMS